MNITVGYIPTAAGTRALTEGIVRAARQHCELRIINVHRLDRPGDLRHANDDALNEAAQLAHSQGVPTATIVHREAESGDDLVDTFLDTVRASTPHLLIIGSRRDCDTPPHLLGKTIQHIVADAPCSVLVV